MVVLNLFLLIMWSAILVYFSKFSVDPIDTRHMELIYLYIQCYYFIQYEPSFFLSAETGIHLHHSLMFLIIIFSLMLKHCVGEHIGVGAQL